MAHAINTADILATNIPPGTPDIRGTRLQFSAAVKKALRRSTTPCISLYNPLSAHAHTKTAVIAESYLKLSVLIGL